MIHDDIIERGKRGLDCMSSERGGERAYVHNGRQEQHVISPRDRKSSDVTLKPALQHLSLTFLGIAGCGDCWCKNIWICLLQGGGQIGTPDVQHHTIMLSVLNPDLKIYLKRKDDSLNVLTESCGLYCNRGHRRGR